MFDFTKLEQSAMSDVETVDMGNDFSLAALKENNEIVEVSIEYKGVCVGIELSLEAAKDYVNSVTSEDIVYLNELVDDFNNS